MTDPPKMLYTTLKPDAFLDIFQQFIYLHQNGYLSPISPNTTPEIALLDNLRRVLYASVVLKLDDNYPELFGLADHWLMNIEINSEKQLHWILNEAKSEFSVVRIIGVEDLKNIEQINCKYLILVYFNHHIDYVNFANTLFA